MRHVVDFDLRRDRVVRVYSEDDVEDVLEHNKHLRATEQKSDWGRHFASVPPIIIQQWLNEAWARGQPMRWASKEFYEMVYRKLQDPEWAYLRVDGPRHRMGWIG